MLTAAERKNLKNLLAMAENPDDTFSYDELLGYIFGLAMTPAPLVPSEWMPTLFGGELPTFTTLEQMQKMTGSLMQAYNTFVTAFHTNKLHLPFNIEKLKENQFEALYEWISGFEEAIALREEVWDPEEFPELSDRKKEELYHSLMTIQGLVDPVEVMDYFEELPDEMFQEAFAGMDTDLGDRELQIQVFLMASLPLAIDTLQKHARTVNKIRQRRLTGGESPTPIRPIKVKENAPCSCDGGTCCDGSAPAKKAPTATSKKGTNVIKVDFPQHGKKQTSPAPVYQLKVALQDAKPPIWRRIEVPGHFTLEQLHAVIQLCMGWTDSHLHQFLIDRTCYCLPNEDDLWQTSRPKNEAKYTLHSLAGKIQPQFQYIYDFGDDWMHQITVEKVLPPKEGVSTPVLITGRRACPPEDIGGIYGYMHLIEVLGNPEHEEYEEMADLLDVDFFDPAQFSKEDIAVINASLEEVFRQVK